MRTTFKTDSVRFTTRGQVVIPSWLRKQFHIEDGTKASVTATPDGILLKPITRASVQSLMGKYASLEAGTKELETERQRDRQKEEESCGS